MPTPINPYVAGNPVGDSPAFIGRADVLREVVRVLRRPQDNAIVLYGQRRIGKTSILQHLAAQLPNKLWSAIGGPWSRSRPRTTDYRPQPKVEHD
jgi:hypothetical protein